jgi:hypothetical protein
MLVRADCGTFTGAAGAPRGVAGSASELSPSPRMLCRFRERSERRFATRFSAPFE